MKRELNAMVVVGILIISSGLTACSGGGGGGEGSAAATATTSTGSFVDAPIQGMVVSSGNSQSTTDINGSFQYTVVSQRLFALAI